MTETRKVGASAGNRGKGRKKGTPNKTTQIAKDAIAIAAEMLGGAERLGSWAKESPDNEKAFWTTIYPKLLPLQVNAEIEAGKRLAKIVREIVRPAHPDG